MTAAALGVARAVLVDARRASLQHHDRAIDKARSMTRVAGSLVDAFGVWLSVTGVWPRQGTIIVANHLGWLDPFLVQFVVPCIPVAKAEVGSWPIVGDFAKRSGTVLVDRHDPYSGMRALRDLEGVLRAGVSILNFPEGTTTTGERVLPFKRGVFGLATRLGVDIVPARIDYDDIGLCWTGNARFVPNALRLALHPGARMRVHFVEPLASRKGETPESLAERTRARLEMRGGT